MLTDDDGNGIAVVLDGALYKLQVTDAAAQAALQSLDAKQVQDGADEVAVRDEELLSTLRVVADELRSIRLMLGHATEAQFDGES